MPSEIADSVDICRHQSHDLRLARKIVLVRLFGFNVSTGRRILSSFLSRARSRGRCVGGNILAHERLRVQDGVQLNPKADLNRRRGQ